MRAMPPPRSAPPRGEGHRAFVAGTRRNKQGRPCDRVRHHRPRGATLAAVSKRRRARRRRAPRRLAWDSKTSRRHATRPSRILWYPPKPCGRCMRTAASQGRVRTALSVAEYPGTPCLGRSQKALTDASHPERPTSRPRFRSPVAGRRLGADRLLVSTGPGAGC